MHRIAVAAAAALVLSLATPTAAASGDDWGLNGTYAALSNGQWAQTNDIYRDEGTVRSTWTITTTCTTPLECTGRVNSDLGWSADVNLHGSEYVVKHDIPDWEPCANGTKGIGHQLYRFYPVDERGWVAWGSTVFAGVDKTSGDSGACGINKNLVITMPFRLEKIG
ncbi:hypothetical protein AWB91_11210 [Mycobacterium paraense]|uniref:Secreted protein n=1 Tax=Mycobacterium paraense TaxID=767916 RepID=A0ABX3VQI6_9MYCO|nr:hypothetical protein [Mycobacterium paraense]ORW32509.1 hypothetical protein AWB91_11210 [Mycobacterium paraense]ORW37857.1 hypothetical protein AWB88_01095 [Mycobacterium paraense]